MTKPYINNSLVLLSLFILSGCAHGGYGRREAGAGYISVPSVVPSMVADRAALCKGLKDVACGERLGKVFDARLSYVYWASDGPRLSQKCQAYPAQCPPEVLEAWAIESHNANLDRMQAYEQQQRRANAAASLQQASQALTPKGTSCTTHLPVGPGLPLTTVCK